MKKQMIKITVALCILLVVMSMSVMAAATGSEPHLEMTRDGYVCTVTPRNVPAGSAVYFAAYAENGQMLDAEVWEVNAENHQFTIPQEAKYAKAFLMSAATGEPLSEEQEVNFLLEISASVFDFGETETETFRYVTTKEDGQYVNGPAKRSATYRFEKESGATYNEKDFQFRYKRQGNDDYETELPSNAGTYDVTVTRPADNTYAAFEHTYENVLVINKGVHINGVMEFADIRIVNRGYTWFEFEVVPTGYAKPSEGATITYYVSPDKNKWYASEGNSNRVSVPEHLGCDWNVRVSITDDPNWEDWTSSTRISYYEEPYQLMPYPTTSWKDHWNDANDGLFDPREPNITITTPGQMAALAEFVNTGAYTFAGQNICLGADIDLIGHKWTPIGNDAGQFQGTFDGQGYTISNLYISGDAKYAGLFGYTKGTDAAPAQVKNVTLTESDISGLRAADCVGAIVAKAQYTEIVNCYSSTYVTCNKEGSPVGGIVGLAEGVSVERCVNEGNVESMGCSGGIVGKITGSSSNLSYISDCTSRTVLNGYKAAGGIVGDLSWAQVNACSSYGSILGNTSGGTGGIVGVCSGSYSEIVNCLNYSTVSTTGENYGVGGIVGIVNAGKVYNCANIYGASVKGYNSVGGIVGLNYADGRVYNCYSAGNVSGSAKGTNWLGIGPGMYTGAIVGRNYKDDGWVTNCYYLAGSARNYSGVASGGGTAKGSTDSETHLETGWFKGWVTNVESNWYGSGKAPLIDILNRWQGDYVNNGYGLATWWVPSAEGYPVPYHN